MKKGTHGDCVSVESPPLLAVFSSPSLPFRPIVNTRQGESGGVSQKRAVRTRNGFGVLGVNVSPASAVWRTEVRSREGGLRRKSAKLVTPVRGEPCVII